MSIACGTVAGEDHYRCRYARFGCQWWVYTAPDTADGIARLNELQAANPDRWITGDLPAH